MNSLYIDNSVLLQMLMLSSFVSHLSHDKPCHYMLIVIRYPNGPVHYVVVVLPSLVWDRGSLGRGGGGAHHSDLAYLDVLTTNIWLQLLKGWIVLSTG